MPFVPALRLQLKHLKEEFDAGIIPNVVYEEMCRNAIKQYTMSSPGENEICKHKIAKFDLNLRKFSVILYSYFSCR